jgi:hypothetical protein
MGIMGTHMTIEELNEQIRRAGYTPAAGAWEDDCEVFAFSVESCGPATYGHPRFCLEYRKVTHDLLHDNRPYRAL